MIEYFRGVSKGNDDNVADCVGHDLLLVTIARVIPPLTCSECLNFSQIIIFCSWTSRGRRRLVKPSNDLNFVVIREKQIDVSLSSLCLFCTLKASFVLFILSINQTLFYENFYLRKIFILYTDITDTDCCFICCMYFLF